MRIESEIKLDYKDVLLRPKRSTLTSRLEIQLTREFRFKHSCCVWSGIPIVAANMFHTGTLSMLSSFEEHQMFVCLSKRYDVGSFNALPSKNYLRFSISTGILEEDWDKMFEILTLNSNIMFVCIDVANGYTQRFVDYVQRVRRSFPNKVIIAGNVVTGEMTEELILKGADIVKVGIGGGSVCTTRIQTGVGYPQLSAVIECADAAHGVGGHIMADGGCVCAGDISKAFCAGADFVMLGGMLAGHTESEGEEEIIDGEKYKVFYGMSSEAAMNKHNGGMATYRSSEGKVTKVKHRGSVKKTIENILGGIRSSCTYIGAKSLKDMPKCATFIRVSQQSNEIFGKNV